MSAEVESLFSVREVPWHGLGTIVEEAPTSKDAIIMAGLNWTVEQKKIFNEQGKEIPGFVANTRDMDDSVLGIVTPKYKPVQNVEAFEFVDALLGEGVTFETAGSLKEGRTIWLLANLPETTILGDAFVPYLVFTNSHDGKGAIQVCSTPTRVVCNNTLNLALRTAKRSWTTKHMGDMKGKLAEAKHTLGMAKDYIEELGVEADRLANLKISDTELEAIFSAMFPIDYEKDTPAKINHVNELKANIFHCYEAPDIKQFRGTAWGVMNAVSDAMSHCRPSRLTKNYQENNFGKIINGHPLLDNFYSSINQYAKSRVA